MLNNRAKKPVEKSVLPHWEASPVIREDKVNTLGGAVYAVSNPSPKPKWASATQAKTD